MRHRPLLVLGVGLVAAVLLLPLGAEAAKLITGADVKDGSLTSADIKAKSLLAGDFKPGQLPRGPQGPAGPEGPTGPQGPQGVISVRAFAGGIGAIPATSGAWAFAGPTTVVTTATGQTILGSASASLMVASGTPYMDFGLCFRQSGNTSPPANFYGGNYMTLQLDTVRRSFGASAAIDLGPGNWEVGACLRADSPVLGDWTNGWVQVVQTGAAGAGTIAPSAGRHR